MRCNICGSDKFVAMNKRPAVRCASCGSVERTRVIKLMLDKLGLPRPGMRVLHLAPEVGLAKYLIGIVGAENYDARDIDIERYKNVGVTYFDLVKDADKLPSRSFDLVIHSHVMEHLPCNVTAVLYHLHRSLTPDGMQVCSIPICGGKYEESFSPIPDEERTRRFGQFDHVRRFGSEDLQLSLGMLFKIPEVYDLTAIFSQDVLREANVPPEAWRGYTPHSVLTIRRGDILLKEEEGFRPAARTFRNIIRLYSKKLFQPA